MNRRKFIKNGSLIGSLFSIGSVVGVSNANPSEINSVKDLENLFSTSKYTSINEKNTYTAVIKNVHSEHFDFKRLENNILNVTTDNLYPFSLPQGDFALQLSALTNGFVIMNLFKLEKEGYRLVGHNIGNTDLLSTNKMTWLKYGIRVLVSN